MILFHELTNSAEDFQILRHFYRECYVLEFPDPNERESLENMEQYLNLKERGWYGKNNYHIVIATQAEQYIGGVVADFLAEANTGVIEFIFVLPQFRQQGIGKTLLTDIESRLVADAQIFLGIDLDCIVAEMNDPFQPSEVEDNLNPVRRSRLWDKWGYGVLDFPYIQPALSEEQQPVFNLLLLAKIFNPNWQQTVSSHRVNTIVREYLRWAMRIEEPEGCAEYNWTRDFLDKHSEIKVLNLGRYVGYDLAKSVNIRAVESETDADFQAVMSVYQGAFAHNRLGVQTQDFIDFLQKVKQSNLEYDYHLWAIRSALELKVEGMVSFFTLPQAGFGGYVVFEGSLLGTGRLRSVLARMEQQMLQDCPDTKGWYIETDALKKCDHWVHMGFREIDLQYQQPPLIGQEIGLKARLLYKPYGRIYGEPSLSYDDLLTAIEQIYYIVYQIDRPCDHPSYIKSISSIKTSSAQQVSFIS
jgi:GNAT superfamily N-acetyltransferase